MTVFAFICPHCGPIRTIPMADIRRRRAAPPSHWCPHCGAPVSASVDYDYDDPAHAA